MILISGEALIDLIPDAGRKNGYDAVLGGSPYNVAIGLGRLGSPTAFVSRLSKDPNGESLAAALSPANAERFERAIGVNLVSNSTLRDGSIKFADCASTRSRR